ncbi:AAA family ATPase [endosymbiont GvMRE of Glomus versiforme]|uniref:AAA family ATPase n=1 Tax=endosymbiont GvMRE of Glomus versiforme TaxID=2039283 RepID=UPI000EE0B9E5|nr:AAA family ATPase [endosymbiont GvMRE of Glomus versiforme]RHZ36276.1 Lon protease [endosymbiont GvMRE of Glomus versiforme]
MPSFSLVETNMDDLTDFSYLFHSFYLPQGEFRFNSNTFQYDYITRQQLIEEQEPKKKKEKPQKDPDQDISEDEWNELWREKEKPCMPTWYLEQIYRNKKRIEKKPNKDETDQARLELCETLLDAFYRSPYVPAVSVFESIMGSPDYDWKEYVVDAENIEIAKANKKRMDINIGDTLEAEVIGFKEFKSQMWENLKVFHRERSLGITPFQVFPYLLGPPGTGKSEITRNLAKAYKRPIQMINVGGMDDGGELEGKRATLQSANYGKVMEAFVERSILAEITIQDLQLEIQEIKTYVDENGNRQERPEENLTEWEEERIEKLEEDIKDWEEENQERQRTGKDPKLTKNKPQRSRAPIILLDEFEKCSRDDVMNVIGKMTDREMNFSFMDKYFNFRLDLSQCQMLLTANYLDKVPQFVRDRGLPINIELLTWEQRKGILRSRFKKELRRFKLGHLLNKITDRFIEMCITETWGIRGGINNVAATVRFLEVLEVDKQTGYLEKLEEYDDLYETPVEKYLKDENGVIRLSYNLNGKTRTLTLTKRIGIEERTVKDEFGQEKKVKEIITGTNADTGDYFVNDWPDEYWWGSKPVRNLGGNYENL